MTKRHRAARTESFVDVVAALPDASVGEGEEIDSPVSSGSWIDRDSVVWRRRGGNAEPARARRLLLERAETRVVHMYAGDARDIAHADRASLWHRIEPYVRGARRMAGDHTDLLVAEFRDVSGRQLLIVEERC